MSDIKKVRRHFFVDPALQGALVTRVVLYWIICLCSVVLLMLAWRIITAPGGSALTYANEMWTYCWPALVTSFLLLPLVVMDILRFSNRFAGPLLRLRRSLRALARGEEVRPIEFREDDFWLEVADEFNAVRLRVQLTADNSAAEQAEHQADETPLAVG
jgi:hypothetical protein